MKKIYFTILLISISLYMSAQIQLGGAIQFIDFSEMNSDFSANAFPTIDENIYSFSIRSAKKKDDSKVVSRGGIMFNHYEKTAFSGTSNLSVNELNLRTIGFVSGSGYDFINKDWISFGPSIDMLIVQNKLTLSEGLPSDLTFGNVLSNDVETEEFKNVKLLFQGNLNLLFKFGKKEGKTEYGIGFTGGYRWDPFNADWRYQRSPVKVEIPGSQQSGFMLGIMVSIKGPDLMPQKPKNKQKRS